MADENITITKDLDPYDYDSLWKDFTRICWREVLYDFMPDLYNAADLTRDAVQLDKELHDVVAGLGSEEETQTTKRYVDNLLKIYLKNGKEEWILLHIEIQGRGGENISARMFRYQCMLFVHHNRHPAAMAILTAKRPKKEVEPGKYEAELFGTKIKYEYNVIKAYELDDEELKARKTITSLFLYALKKGKESRKSEKDKFAYMKEIMELAAKMGFDINKRRFFMGFVERAIKFKSKDMWRKYLKHYKKIIEEDTSMKYKPVVDEIYEEEFASKLLKLGTFSDEQIAELTNQTADYVASLRKELAL